MDQTHFKTHTWKLHKMRSLKDKIGWWCHILLHDADDERTKAKQSMGNECLLN